MKEIGGYIELEHYHGKMLHESGVKLNCGRNALIYLIQQRGISEIWLPDLICDSVIGACERAGCSIRFYPVRADLSPDTGEIPADAWLYVVNYYGQYSAETLFALRTRFPHMILDLAQAYFDEPLADTDTLYTCRKFFGVADGAVLYTDAGDGTELPESKSHDQMAHLLGRYECGGSAFYRESVENNHRMKDLPPARMSPLTENLLHSIDYGFVRDQRTRNFARLADALDRYNALRVRRIAGAFAYPLLIADGAAMRKALQQQKIYIPVLWPNVLETADPQSAAYRLAADVLPLPCDQRYSEADMDCITDAIASYLRRN